MLARCDEMWGGDELRPGRPDVEEHGNVAFLPQGALPAHLDPHWGLYDRDGRLIELGAWRRESPGNLIGQSQVVELRDFAFAEAPDSTYLYGGVAVTHFGHFLCTTLARLWMLAEDVRQLKIVFHSHGDVPHILSFPFIREIFAAVGITESNFVIFREPVRIRHLIVPGAAFEEQNFVYDAFRELGHRIGRALIPHHLDRFDHRPLFVGDPGWSLQATDWLGFSNPPRTGTNVYLTKTALRSGQHIWRDEQVIEDRMRREGCEIVRPEALALKEQMALFTGGRTIVGTSTSAFHSSIFSPASGKIVGLNHIRNLNSNFLLIDKVNGNDAAYYFPASGYEVGDMDRQFHNVIAPRADIHTIADQFCELALL